LSAAIEAHSLQAQSPFAMVKTRPKGRVPTIPKQDESSDREAFKSSPCFSDVFVGGNAFAFSYVQISKKTYQILNSTKIIMLGLWIT